MLDTSTLEERVSRVEQDLALLKSQVDRLRPKETGIDPISGSAEGEPAATGLPQPANPWLCGAGMFCDDPLFDEWQRAIAQYRRDVDAAADAP